MFLCSRAQALGLERNEPRECLRIGSLSDSPSHQMRERGTADILQSKEWFQARLSAAQ